MNSYESMKKALLPIGLYGLKNSDLISRELSVYSEVIDPLSSRVDELITECFVTTAQDFGLTDFEKLIGPERDDLELSKRRDMILSLINLNVNDNNMEGIKRFFRTLDVECEIEESPMTQNIYIRPKNIDIGLEERRYIRKRAEEFLPCHNTFTIDFRNMTWSDYDSYGRTFDEIDKLRLTWEKFEEYEEE